MTTQPLELDWQRFVDDVRALAAESPDFVYTPVDVDGVDRCRYFPDDANPQGCLIGAALARQGVDTTTLDGAAFMVLHGLSAPNVIADWANDVQREQDSGCTWSKAVADAGWVPA